MNRTLKRVLGLTASVTLGLAGAVAFASGAQAHHTEVAPETGCLEADGSWTVTWSVTDWDWKNYGEGNLGAGTITEVKTTPDVALEGDIAVGETLPYPGEGALTATQTFDSSVESATLVVKAKWPNGQKGNNKDHLKTAYKPTQLCEPDDEPSTPAPEAETQQDAWSDCFGITVWVANLNPDKLATFTLTPSNGDVVETTPEAGQEGESYYFPASEDGEELSVDVSVDGGEATTYAWEPAGGCEFGEYFETCDGIEFSLSVPADGVETTYTFTTSENEEPVVYVLAPGDTQDVSFDGVPGLVVYLLIEQGKSTYPFEFEWVPCDTPSESESPSAPPQLPTTGSSLSIMIGSAAALIVAAAAILLVMRRRRAAQDW